MGKRLSKGDRMHILCILPPSFISGFRFPIEITSQLPQKKKLFLQNKVCKKVDQHI